jgi:ubiquinone/menaquinone biosynthesis C-methylase UbiE
MTENAPPNQVQSTIWNERGGRTWADLQAMLDRLFQPFEAPLVDAIAAAGGKRVLDVGCGAGSTTLAAARRLGPTSRCTGIDISAPLIEAAKARAAADDVTGVTFIEADAQTYGFTAGSFDTVMSRLGVMFFDDPVAAFANLRRATRPGGLLAFVAWRSREENPFMTAAERAAAPLVKELAMRTDGSPGQFAFASADRVKGMLHASGWTSIEIRPVDFACSVSAAELPVYVTRMGPYGLIRDTLDENLRARADAAVLAAFESYVEAEQARFICACWSVTASA